MKKRKNILVLPIVVLCILSAIVIVGVVLTCMMLTRDDSASGEPVQALPPHGYDFAYLYSDGQKRRYEDASHTSLFGIDVSVHQDAIDWQKVKEDGVEFAFLRIGYRGATEGLLNTDKRFEENYKGARDSGILVGVYFYSQAIDVKEAQEEAQFVLSLMKDRELDLPIVYDYEEPYMSDATSRMASLDSRQRTDNALAFLKEIGKRGYDVMIYANRRWLEDCYIAEDIADCRIWYAQYDVEAPSIERPFDIWQYSESGKIKGIDVNVDLDIMFLKKEDDSHE